MKALLLLALVAAAAAAPNNKDEAATEAVPISANEPAPTVLDLAIAKNLVSGGWIELIGCLAARPRPCCVGAVGQGANERTSKPNGCQHIPVEPSLSRLLTPPCCRRPACWPPSKPPSWRKSSDLALWALVSRASNAHARRLACCSRAPAAECAALQGWAAVSAALATCAVRRQCSAPAQLWGLLLTRLNRSVCALQRCL